METCQLFVGATIPPQATAHFKIETQSQAGTTKESLDVAKTIIAGGQSLTLIETTEGQIKLELTDKSGDSYQVAFGLEYYNPSNGTTIEGQSTLPSGAYIFKPKMDDQVSHPYSQFLKYSVQPSNASEEETVASAFVFEFEKPVGEPTEGQSETYQLLVRLVDNGLNVIEFDVNMLGIPVNNGQGQEVIAKWTIVDSTFSNDQTFYTDSNGLEMQKRVLNYRDTFTLDTDMQVSSNYYPINSAISVKSTAQSGPKVQMTVINDRAQGGSSL